MILMTKYSKIYYSLLVEIKIPMTINFVGLLQNIFRDIIFDAHARFFIRFLCLSRVLWIYKPQNLKNLEKDLKGKQKSSLKKLRQRE